jgi:argininosuccinate lyase
MPQKRNPDVFELTRARASALEGDLAAVLAVRGKLTSGYHRDFQLLKGPLLRGLGSTGEMLAAIAAVLPELEVNRERGRALLAGGVLATDAALRLVERGVPFRSAYREVATALRAGAALPPIPAREIIARRRSEGGVGNLDLAVPRRRLRAERARNRRERARFDRALRRLAGG